MNTKYIGKIIEENFNSIISENIIDERAKQQKSKKKKRRKKSSSKPKDPKEMRNKHQQKARVKRMRVIRWLKDKSVNCAEIMRLLWHPSKKKEDAARSYFYKCRDGKLNDSGDAYSFTDSDITRLYSIRNGKSQ